MLTTWFVIRTGVKASVEIFTAKFPPRLLFASHIPRVISQALFFVLIVRFARGPDAVYFALVGNAIAMAALVAVVYVGGLVGEDRGDGLLPYLMAVPTNPIWILVGRSAAFYLDSLLSAVLALVVVGAIVGAIVDPLRIAAALPAVLLVCATLTAMGLLIANLALVTRHHNTVANLIYYGMLLFCGVNYPVQMLPAAAQVVSRMLPMTHGLDALRGLLASSSYAQVLQPLALEALIGVVYAIVGYVLFQWQTQRARRIGNIEFV